MFDLWGFLLQTLTASGVAILLIIIKLLFKDKLPPKWHFAVWGVLGIVLLIPAGWNGRYTIICWQYLIELIKGLIGEFSITRVLGPIPVINSMPHTITDWIFIVYFVGVFIHLAKYAYSYIRLRLVLKKGKQAVENITDAVKELSLNLKIKPCRVIEVHGLRSAFVCGVIRPVLVVPRGQIVDDKVLLHELMHLKSKDTLLNIVICVLRSIHWCNPLLVYCANAAINDMEYRCDQFVLERLEGEERREYGYILLSMANDLFAKTPGTTCINNGGKYIRNRIETIARFKKYPVGMSLVSICVLILLTISLVIGVQATEFYAPDDSTPLLSFASARCNYCSTYAGAFDTYGKSVLKRNGYYRIMCAPNTMHEDLYNKLIEFDKTGEYPNLDYSIPAITNEYKGYYVYNLKQLQKNVYEGMMVFELCYPPTGQSEEKGILFLAVQNVRVEKKAERWVAMPTEEFNFVKTTEADIAWGCNELPGIIYAGNSNEMQVDLKVQTVHAVESIKQDENNIIFGDQMYYDTKPQPNAVFTEVVKMQSVRVTHLGTREERNDIKILGFSMAPVYSGDERPENLTPIIKEDAGFDIVSGEFWNNKKTEPGWGPSIEMSGCVGSFAAELDEIECLPEYYVADLYANNEITAQLDLHLQGEVVK